MLAERRTKSVKELSLSNDRANKIMLENTLLRMAYESTPANVFKLLHAAHKGTYDTNKEGLSVKSLVRVMGVANKMGMIHGMDHEEAQEYLQKSTPSYMTPKYG